MGRLPDARFGDASAGCDRGGFPAPELTGDDLEVDRGADGDGASAAGDAGGVEGIVGAVGGAQGAEAAAIVERGDGPPHGATRYWTILEIGSSRMPVAP